MHGRGCPDDAEPQPQRDGKRQRAEDEGPPRSIDHAGSMTRDEEKPAGSRPG